MLGSIDKELESDKDNSFNTDILEQSFSQLPTEGKIYLKKYLQNLVSLQSVMAAMYSPDTDNASLLKG
ncbi:MAG: hypothetical protein FWF38_01070 [Spirochaetaceae bacterium]|nr:hypothetical protein [Spirochaetaceae bacterium]